MKPHKRPIPVSSRSSYRKAGEPGSCVPSWKQPTDPSPLPTIRHPDGIAIALVMGPKGCISKALMSSSSGRAEHEL